MMDKQDEVSTLKPPRGVYIQSNPLIEAQRHMDIMETRLFALAIQQVRPHTTVNDKAGSYDDEFPLICIRPNKLAEIFGNTWYLSAIEKKAKKLFSTAITVRDHDGKGFELRHVFEVMGYRTNEGLYLQFHKKMKPYILDLVGKGFTKIEMIQIFHLSSVYAWRLLELLLRFRGTGKTVLTRTMSVEELRYALDVPEDAYPRMDNFRRFVIDNPLEEINNKTKYIFTYDVLRNGRRVRAFLLKLDTSHVKADEYTTGDFNALTDGISRIKEHTPKELVEFMKNAGPHTLENPLQLPLEYEKASSELLKISKQVHAEVIPEGCRHITREMLREIRKRTDSLLAQYEDREDNISKPLQDESPSYVSVDKIKELKPQNKNIDLSDFNEMERDAIKRMLDNYHLAPEIAIGFMKGSGLVYCQNNMEYVRKASKNGNVTNQGGLLKEALENDYAGAYKSEQEAKAREERARRENIQRDKEAKEFFGELKKRMNKESEEKTALQVWEEKKNLYRHEIMDELQGRPNFFKELMEAMNAFDKKYPKPAE